MFETLEESTVLFNRIGIHKLEKIINTFNTQANMVAISSHY